MKLKVVLATAVALAAAAPAAASRVNLLVNGSFETGDFTGWTLTGADSEYFGVTEGALFPGDGLYYGYFGTVGDVSGLQQTVATRAGQDYTLSFDLQNTTGGPSSKSIAFGGTVVAAAADEEPYDPTSFSYTVHATAPSTVLAFEFRQDPGYYILDNVSLTASGAVPEPAVWAMMIGGFGLVGATQRRRTAALAA